MTVLVIAPVVALLVSHEGAQNTTCMYKAPSTRAMFMWQFLFARVNGSKNICC